MKTKLQIKSIFGKVLFEYETEDNSIRKTLEEAIKTSANLTSADLTSADLRSADLRYADLRYANLTSANLRYANLRSADLRSADLRYANLRYANLTSANLRYANLRSAKNKEFSYMPQFCKWSHSIIGDKIQIGCKSKTILEWQIFFDSKEEYSTARDTQDFKQIQAIFESYKAYMNTLNK